MATNAAVRHKAAASGISENAFLMFFFAGFAALSGLVFALYARSYPLKEHYRTA